MVGWALAGVVSCTTTLAHAQLAGQSRAEGGTGAAAEISKIAATYPFAGTTLQWWHSLNAISLNPGAEQTFNPTYTWLVRFQPRYAITDKLRVSLKLDLNLELTNSDDTTKYRETQLGDTWLDFSFGPYKESFTGINVTPNLRFVLPTSKTSQARSLYTSISPAVSLNRSWKVGSMTLGLSYMFRYSKNLNKFTTVQYDTPSIASCQSFDADCGRYLHTGVRNSSMDFWNIFGFDWGITSKLNFSAMVALLNQIPYALTAANVPVAGGNSVAVGDTGDVRNRAAVWYYFDMSYSFHPTITWGVGISTFNAQLAEDSTFRAPFVNRFTELTTYLSFSIDAIVAMFDSRRRAQ